MSLTTYINDAGLSNLFLAITFVVFTLTVLHLIVDSKRAGLSHIPGPCLARYTDAWALHRAWSAQKHGDKAKSLRLLQHQYGDVVRTGPRSVTVFDPLAVPTIYGVRTKLNKVCHVSNHSKLANDQSERRLRSFSPGRRHDKPAQHARRKDARPISASGVKCIFHVIFEGL